MNKLRKIAATTAVGTLMLGSWAGVASAEEENTSTDTNIEETSTDTSVDVSPDTDLGDVLSGNDVSDNLSGNNTLSGNETGVANGDNLNGDNGSGNDLAGVIGDILG